MSDIGLYSSMYEEIRDVAELIDSVIVSARSESPVSNNNWKRLADILSRVSDTEPVGPLIQVLRLRLRARQWDLKSILEELRTGNASPATVEQLEQLARDLEQERRDTFSRIRRMSR